LTRDTDMAHLSVRLSVALQYCAKTAAYLIGLYMTIILVLSADVSDRECRPWQSRHR